MPNPRSLNGPILLAQSQSKKLSSKTLGFQFGTSKLNIKRVSSSESLKLRQTSVRFNFEDLPPIRSSIDASSGSKEPN